MQAWRWGDGGRGKGHRTEFQEEGWGREAEERRCRGGRAGEYRV